MKYDEIKLRYNNTISRKYYAKKNFYKIKDKILLFIEGLKVLVKRWPLK